MRNSVSIFFLSMVAAAPALAGGGTEPYIDPAPVVAVVAPQPTAWTGGYVGGNISWGNGALDAANELSNELSDLGYSSTLSEPSGTSGAIRGGYDWQNGQVVFGVGGEYNFGTYDGGPVGVLAEGAEELGITDLNVEISRMATLFGRLGFAANDQFMAYGLLGYTWANGEVSAEGESESGNLGGMTIGLGGEYKFNTNWAGYGEYSYTNFGEIDDTDGLFEADMNLFKLGVNYRF